MPRRPRGQHLLEPPAGTPRRRVAQTNRRGGPQVRHTSLSVLDDPPAAPAPVPDPETDPRVLRAREVAPYLAALAAKVARWDSAARQGNSSVIRRRELLLARSLTAYVQTGQAPLVPWPTIQPDGSVMV